MADIYNTYDIPIPPEAEAAVKRLRDNAGLGRAIARELDFQNQLTIRHIVERYMSFPSDFKTVGGYRLQGVRHRTGRLSHSIRNSRAFVTAGGVVSAIGSNVAYAVPLEFGADFPSRPTSSKNKYYARKHPRTMARTMAGRHMVQRGIEDRLAEYTEGLGRAILRFESNV